MDPENIGLAVGISFLSCLEPFRRHFAVNRASLNMFDDFSYVIGGATIKFSKQSNRKILQVSNAKNRMQKFASVLEILKKVWGVGPSPLPPGKKLSLK